MINAPMLGFAQPLGIALEGAVDRPGGRWNGVMTPDLVGEGQDDTFVSRLRSGFLSSARGSPRPYLRRCVISRLPEPRLVANRR